MKSLHVAVGQVLSGPAPQDVLKRMERLAGAASLCGVDVILFAETVLHGFDLDRTAAAVEKQAVPLDSEVCQHISAIARSANIAILAGFLEKTRS